jgi:two-component system, LytTR family, response regulator
LKNKARVVVSKTLKESGKSLRGHRFFRIHDSTLVNLNHVRRYLKEEGGKVLLLEGIKLNVARRRRNELVERLEGGI